MKIGIYCTNNVVYPLPYGTIYANMAVAGQLADYLADQGHDVTFFAPVGSKTKAKLVTFDMLPFSDEKIYSKYPHAGSSYEYENIMMIQALNYAEAEGFDVFHTHSRPFSVVNFAPLKPQIPVIATIHDPLADEAFSLLNLYNQFPNLHFVSLSIAQRRPQPNLQFMANVYNGIDLNEWHFNPKPENYLLFAGRIMPEKGAHIAVRIAQESGYPLKIAGSLYPHSEQYFAEEISPHLNDKIEYLGSISQIELRKMYQNALALLMPIRWEEPFGLVVIEALACGTPVIATRRGSIPEIIEDGTTGIILDDSNDLVTDYVAAIKQINNINRQTCRDVVEERFSIQAMADNYLKLYQDVANGS